MRSRNKFRYYHWIVIGAVVAVFLVTMGTYKGKWRKFLFPEISKESTQDQNNCLISLNDPTQVEREASSFEAPVIGAETVPSFQQEKLVEDQKHTSGNIYFSHIDGGGVGYSTGYSSFKAIGLFEFQKHLFFVDARQHVFNTGRPAGNIGFGGRFRAQPLVVGLNAYYDYRKHWRFYNQVGCGLEIKSCIVDFTTNGYFIVGAHSKSRNRQTYTYPGGYFASCAKKESALSGADAELSSGLKKVYPCSNWDLIGGIGTYYYWDRECGDPFWGGKARLGVEIFRYLYIEGRVSFDPVFHTKVQGLLTLSIPLGKKKDQCTTRCSKEHLRDLSEDLVQRNEIIVVDKKFCNWCSNF